MSRASIPFSSSLSSPLSPLARAYQDYQEIVADHFPSCVAATATQPDTRSMSTEITQPTRQALAAVERSAPRKVTGRLRSALVEMIWKGSRRADAAKAAGMTDHSLREALRKPHVKAWYLQELRVLRESERPRTFHRLCDLRDQDANRNAAVAASRTLEQISDAEVSRPMGTQTQPGLVIILGSAANAIPQASPVTIDVAPVRKADDSDDG